ncbi:MAG TPA: hypothetical protein VKB46_04625 [Pyrinomonadaceae bacterium]|nr:hypothetical protein [Pyrinomonadaceae bacterium]
MKTNAWITRLGVAPLLLTLGTVSLSQTTGKPCGLTLTAKSCTTCSTKPDQFLLNFRHQPATSESLPVNPRNTDWLALSFKERNRGNELPCYENRFSSVRREEKKVDLHDPEPLHWNEKAKLITDQGQAQPAAGSDAHELAKKLSNPVASLISVPFQSNFDFGMGAGSGWRYTLNIQPVIPISLGPKWNLISRTILPIIHQDKVAGSGSQSGLGDITQSFFFSPTDSKRFIWAIGPALLIPTATNDFLGTKKFGIGPTALILKQQEQWTYGVLINHIWSVAGSDTRASVNNTFIQPFLAYNTKDAWTFNVNTEASYDWTGNAWSIPIHFTVTKLIKVGQRPVSIGGALRCWAASPEGGPETCGLRIIVTPLFPK